MLLVRSVVQPLWQRSLISGVFEVAVPVVSVCPLGYPSPTSKATTLTAPPSSTLAVFDLTGSAGGN